MSWDISIIRLPVTMKSIDDIPDNYQPPALGTRAEVIAQILGVIPDVNFSDPSWGMLDRKDVSMEFNMGAEEKCSGFGLHVRGNSQETVWLIDQLLTKLDLRGFDSQSGELFSVEEASKTFGEWQAYRNRVASPASDGSQEG